MQKSEKFQGGHHKIDWKFREVNFKKNWYPQWKITKFNAFQWEILKGSFFKTKKTVHNFLNQTLVMDGTNQPQNTLMLKLDWWEDQ